jgi:acyl-coenzyme A synthetase/AMP-(fatty) acid ligase
MQPVGDSLLQSDLRQLRAELPAGCAILNTYGSSEALASLQWFVPAPYTRAGAKVGSGYRLPGYEYALLDEHGTAAAPGEPGELVLRSRHMSLGVWRGGRLEPGPFVADPQDPALSIHRTGDLAMLAEDGLFTVLGRRDRQVKIRGNRVELAEIEEALRAQPGVAQVAVAARPRAADPELIAFVVPADPAAPDLRARLAEALRGALPSYMQPGRIDLLAALPLLPGGKADIEALLARVAG